MRKEKLFSKGRVLFVIIGLVAVSGYIFFIAHSQFNKEMLPASEALRSLSFQGEWIDLHGDRKLLCDFTVDSLLNITTELSNYQIPMRLENAEWSWGGG